MAYRLRIAAEVRLWLHDLRAADPDEARLVGEAVTALAAAGPGLGPPLVTTVAAARPALSPLSELDRSYQRQLEFLQRVRRGVADVATSRKRIDLQVSQLETAAARLERQRADALEDGSQELAQQTGARLQAAGSQLAALRENLAEIAATEAELTAASQRLMARVDAFRSRKEAVRARFTAAEAHYVISLAAREVSEQVSEQAGEPLDEPADEPPDEPLARSLAAAGAEIRSAAGLEAELAATGRELADSAGSPDSDTGPAELLELRPGAARGSDLRLLFAIDPPGTVVLLDAGWPSRELGEPQELDDWYSESVEVARERLADGLLTAYGAGMFVREFFPGDGPQVEAGAVALARQAHRHDLAELRERAGLSRAQLADAMSVPAGRIPDIENTEPGDREGAVLAAYVQALGGRLEIAADIGADRMVLRHSGPRAGEPLTDVSDGAPGSDG